MLGSDLICFVTERVSRSARPFSRYLLVKLHASSLQTSSPDLGNSTRALGSTTCEIQRFAERERKLQNAGTGHQKQKQSEPYHQDQTSSATLLLCSVDRQLNRGLQVCFGLLVHQEFSCRGRPLRSQESGPGVLRCERRARCAGYGSREPAQTRKRCSCVCSGADWLLDVCVGWQGSV